MHSIMWSVFVFIKKGKKLIMRNITPINEIFEIKYESFSFISSINVSTKALYSSSEHYIHIIKKLWHKKHYFQIVLIYWSVCLRILSPPRRITQYYVMEDLSRWQYVCSTGNNKFWSLRICRACFFVIVSMILVVVSGS